MEEKLKKQKLTITLPSNILKFIGDNYSKKSKFIEYCIVRELEHYKEYKNENK